MNRNRHHSKGVLQERLREQEVVKKVNIDQLYSSNNKNDAHAI